MIMQPKAILAALCLAIPASAMAMDFSYDYIEGIYVESKYENDSVFGESLRNAESSGGYINLGLAPSSTIYTKIGVGYNAVDNTGIDIASVTGTVGGHVPLTDRIDFYLGAVAAYGRASDLKFPPPNVADNRDDVDAYGLGGEIGVRAWLFPQFELEANGTYVNLFGGNIDDVSNDTDDFNATLGARFHATRQFSVGAGYSYAFGNELKSWQVGVRYNFCCS